MTTLVTYRAVSGRRELVFVAVPDEPGLTLLLDAAADHSDPADVVIVDEALVSVAEARVVARGWAEEQAADPATISETSTAPTSVPAGQRRILGRYRTGAGHRLVVGQRINGEACVLDIPATHEGRVHLVARGLTTRRELDALVADYLQQSARRRHPARHAESRTVDRLAEAIRA